MRRLWIFAGAFTLLLACSLPVAAVTVSYTLGDWAGQFPGPVTPPAGAPHSVDGWGYPGDTVTLEDGTGQINLSDGASGTMSIGTLKWGVDYTYNGTGTAWDYPANWPDLTFLFTATRTITIGAASGNVSQNGTLISTWDDDDLSLSAGPTSSVYVEDSGRLYRVDISPESLGSANVTNFNGSIDPPTGGFAQPDRPMTAGYTVTDLGPVIPEPLTMLGMFLGLGSVGAYIRRRRRA